MTLLFVFGLFAKDEVDAADKESISISAIAKRRLLIARMRLYKSSSLSYSELIQCLSAMDPLLSVLDLRLGNGSTKTFMSIL